MPLDEAAKYKRKTPKPLEFFPFIRKPFTVEAVEVTEDNIAEIAKSVGKLMTRYGKPYIHVNPDLVPNVTQVHPGYWMTRMDGNIRCYSERVFKEQFQPVTGDPDDV